MKKHIIGYAVLLTLVAISVAMASYPRWSGTLVGIADWTGDQFSSANPFPTVSGPASYNGTMTLTANTSMALVTANVTMNNSTALPSAGAFANLRITNTGASNAVYVCWFGGTCSATAGGELLNANGGSDMLNLTGSAVAPTLYSTSGTTLTFHN